MTVDKNIELKDLKNDNHFSVDLQAQAKKHLVFLHALHKLGITTRFLAESFLDHEIRLYHKAMKKMGVTTINFYGHDRAFVDHSLRRYLNFWVPLVAEAQKRNQQVIPPPDIAWMWHCHRLAPYRYSEHVKGLFGSVVDASHPFVFQLEGDNSNNETWTNDDESFAEIAKTTRDLFEELYPNDSFFFEDASKPPIYEKSTAAKFRLLSSYDVVAACQRQATFLWHASGPKFSEDAFLAEGVENYFRFVKLSNHPQRNNKNKNNTKMTWVVPTFQIDCLWHTHILSDIQGYDNDVKQITGGSILDHDDSINDRSEGGILDTSFQQTKELWKEVYGVDYFVEGAMYQGEPPLEFYRRDCFDPHRKESSQKEQVQKESSQKEFAPAKIIVEDSKEWMPPDHDLAFLPFKINRFGLIEMRRTGYKEGYAFGPRTNGYKEGDVFGPGGEFVH